ncbi:MAG: signal recognition particle protein [Candidatus Latescibacteria bacterium]|nr:signal recognition particle protein [Candidatus Latescibacterota bacterium]
MFENLTERLEATFRRLRGYGVLTESNIEEALRDVRRALLEADVNYKVAKEFIDRVKGKAIGQDVLKSLTPAQQVVKVVHQELVDLMGGTAVGVRLSGTPPTILMLVGLQGSGKTTAAAKLAHHFARRGKRPILGAADVYRPAAITQLEVLGGSINVPVYRAPDGTLPPHICEGAVVAAKRGAYDIVILDTAGRLHVDSDMMAELEEIRQHVNPDEILFVADGMTGQDAVNTAKIFADRIAFTGVILTKLDGDTRGGAALSIRAVTGVPIKFVGVGEKVDALEPFHPDRIASRILGMGDILSLVERAEQAVDQEKARQLERKLRREAFTFDDFLEQLGQIKKMGPLDQLLGMIPGVGHAVKGLAIDDRAFVKVEAIINSMTREERRKPHIIDGSRRRRIAKGSGTTIQDVNQLIKQFFTIQKMMKQIGRFRPGGPLSKVFLK